MKKISSLFLLTATVAAMTGCTEKNNGSSSESSEKTTPDSITYSWQTPYEEKIAEFMSSADYSENSCFDILDLSGDGTPELIISPNSDATTKCLIYTFNGGIVSDLGEIGNNGTFSFCPDITVIRDEYIGSGLILGKIYSLADGPMKTLVSYSDNSASASMGAAIYHEINGEKLSLADYEKALEPYSALNTIETGRRFTMGDKAVNYGICISENWPAVLTSDQKKLCISKLSAEAEAAANDGRNGAFDFCDFNGDKVPELVISADNTPDSTCKIYYFSGGQLTEMEGEYGKNGVLSFDIKNYVFFADNTYWSIANSAFIADQYQKSDSITETGRKYPLSESGISAVSD